MKLDSLKMKRVSSFCTSAISKHPMFSQFSQLSSQSQQIDDDRKPYIYFIVPPGQTVEECLTLNLGEMYQTAEAHALNVMWLEDEECMGQELHADGNIFVFDPFGSPGFQYWMTRLSSGKSGSPRVEILGPMVLRKVFTDPQDVSFQTRESPLCTLAMKDMIISFSGIKSKETKNELETLVRWMNGTLSSTLTKAVSHVVTENALTPKCIEANKQGIPVMLCNWIRQLWEDNQSTVVAPSDMRYVKFKCPIFHNITICMSQLTAVKKSTLKAAVEKNGGKVTSEFVKKVTDVLVIQNPTGDKFKFAGKWNVPCVTPQWIEMSLEKGYLLSTNDFKLIAPVAQTPVSPNMPRPMMISTPAHSMMMPAEWNMTRCSAIMEVDDTNRVVVDESKLNFTRTFTEMHEDAVSKLKTSAENLYLDGCKVYVVEYPKCDELKRALNKSGAVRVDKLCEGVTHVIVNPDGQNLPKSVFEKIQALETPPHVVTIDWVLQSAKDGNPADEDLYKYRQPGTTICQETFNPPPASSLNLSSRIARVSATAMEHHPQNTLSRVSGGNTPSDPTTNTRRSSELRRDDAGTTGTTENSNSATNTTDDSDVTQEGNSSTSSLHSLPHDSNINSSSPGLLVGLTFKVVNSDEAERKFIEETIVENGGTLVKDNPTVAILEPICESIEKDRAEKAYTKHWLIECLEDDSLDIDHSFYHTPLCSFRKMDEILGGVVVAISQFGAIEREYLIDVVKALGGKYQDVFARKDSADGKNSKSTHLICKTMDTDKAKAARKWNVPVVVAEWVTESCIERKRLDESRFDPAQVSSADDRTVFMPTPQRRRTMNANNANNMSVRSVYPPSTQKGKPKPNEIFKDKNAGSTEQAKVIEKEKTPPPTAQPSTSKSSKPDSSNDKFRTPTSAPRKTPVAKSKNGDVEEEEDSFLAGLSPCMSDEEMARQMAELKAAFPYSDESYQRHLDDLAARGIDLANEASFTAEENAYYLNPCPDSPLVMGLPRHESRALKEQFEIALNRETYIPNRIKMKPPTSTPLSQIVKRFNSIRHDGSSPTSSPHASSPRASTPITNLGLRKVAAINQRRSQGNLPLNLDDGEEVESGSPVGIAGIKKLGNKRPSDGSPEEEEPKTSKRARNVSGDDSDVGEIIPIDPQHEPGPSSRSNGVPLEEKCSPEKLETSKKPNRMQALSDLIAESKPSESNDNEQGSPIKRRSADNVLVPGDEVPEEEIERPHLSWVENDEESVADKKSTVKKASKVKPRIVPANKEAEVPPATPEPEQNPNKDTKKRSSRLKKTSSIVGTEEGSGRVTRNTRARSASKTRDEPPIGHQPIKIGETKKSRKKKAKLPINLPDAPIFVLSSLDPNQRKSAIEAIVRLGGSISKLQHFDMNCHAVVTSTLLRSEKILGCIASGKFILKPEYLEKSGEAGHFLPIDEEYLWHEGNINQDKERELAQASFGWLNIQMADPSQKPMTGMKFFLLENGGDKTKAFERLILAAGGEVVTKLVDATIVLRDEKNLKEVPEGIEAVNPMHLNTLILTIAQV